MQTGIHGSIFRQRPGARNLTRPIFPRLPSAPATAPRLTSPDSRAGTRFEEGGSSGVGGAPVAFGETELPSPELLVPVPAHTLELARADGHDRVVGQPPRHHASPRDAQPPLGMLEIQIVEPGLLAPLGEVVRVRRNDVQEEPLLESVTTVLDVEQPVAVEPDVEAGADDQEPGIVQRNAFSKRPSASVS